MYGGIEENRETKDRINYDEALHGANCSAGMNMDLERDDLVVFEQQLHAWGYCLNCLLKERLLRVRRIIHIH